MTLHGTLIVLVTLLPALIYPALAYTYRRRLHQRRAELEAMVNGKESAALYQKAFGVEPVVLFKKTFSSRAYWVPVFMNMLFAWIMTAVAFDRAGVPGVLPASFKVITQQAAWRPVLAALLGGFIWGIYDTLRRFRSGNLSPDALHFTWLRMLIAGALGPFVTKIFNIDDPANMLTFGLGIFPVKTLSDLVQGQIVKRGNLQLSSVPSEPPTLDKLQGMTTLTIETLSEADVESCEQLAFSDPLRLNLRTNLPWKVIIDLIDQALLFTYVTEKSKELRVLGIRGVIELAALHEVPADDAGRAMHQSILQGIAEKIGTTEFGVRNLIDTVHFDYQTRLIAALWGGAFDERASERQSQGTDAGIPENELAPEDRRVLALLRQHPVPVNPLPVVQPPVLPAPEPLPPSAGEPPTR